MPPESARAEELLERLQAFVAELEPDHRSLLAALLAPGVAQAYDENDVAGFDSHWQPQPLPRPLLTALRRRPLDIDLTATVMTPSQAGRLRSADADEHGEG